MIKANGGPVENFDIHFGSYAWPTAGITEDC